MPTLSVPGCTLRYDVHALTAPWIEKPQTVLFHHGLGATSGVWSRWLPELVDRVTTAMIGGPLPPASELPGPGQAPSRLGEIDARQ